MVFRTFLTLGLSDRRPLPLDSAIVGRAELLLFRLNDPKRSERDNERESGLSRCNVEACEELGEDADDSVAFLSNSVVTNLSSSAKSAGVFEERFTVLEALPPPDAKLAIGSTSESCNEEEWNSLKSFIIIIK